MNRMVLRKGVLLATLLAIYLPSLQAQQVYERHTYEVYNYLSRLAQKGVLVFDDLIRPLRKETIREALDSVAAHENLLSAIEKKELAFYQREFTEGVRKRILSASHADFSIYADPIVTASFISGKGRNSTSTSSGINFWGRAGKHWGYQFSFHDTNEKGTGLDSSGKSLESGAATGTVRQNMFMVRKQNFTEMRASIHYTFKNGGVSVGQDYLLWGYGENGRIVLSDKAPVYPYLRFDYQPFKWLRFNYTHAWLRSNLIDSARSYSIPSGYFSGIREVEISKYMASHSIDFLLKKGLSFSLGESIISNDRLNIGFLIPVSFFKAFDNANSNTNIERGSNGQFFFQMSSRNQLKNTHLYGTLFIDEIKLFSLFDQVKRRNQLGYTIGGTVTDVGVPYLTLGAEYSRVRPFVYRNFLPAQNYTHQGYLLGEWIGSNADRITAFAKYTPLPRLKLNARYTYVRKGGEGTLDQQYQEQPQQPFLFNLQQQVDEMVFSASYEYLHRLYLHANFRRFDQRNTFFMGMTYGL